jgi:hypothetical protein
MGVAGRATSHKGDWDEYEVARIGKTLLDGARTIYRELGYVHSVRVTSPKQ